MCFCLSFSISFFPFFVILHDLLSKNVFPATFFTLIQLIEPYLAEVGWKEEESICFVFYLCHSSGNRPAVSQSSRCSWMIRSTCQLVQHSHLSHSDCCEVLNIVRPLQCMCVWVCCSSNE